MHIILTKPVFCPILCCFRPKRIEATTWAITQQSNPAYYC